MGVIFRFVRWLLEKLATGGLIALLAVAGFAAWYFLRDNVNFSQWRGDVLRTLNGERGRTLSAMADVNNRMLKLAADRAAEEKRVADADKIVAELRGLESTWDKLIGNPDQQKLNTDQRIRMEKLRDDSLTRVSQLKQEYTRSGWEKDGLEIALGKLDGQLKAVEADKSAVAHYLSRAWDRTRRWVLGALAIYIFGPTVSKLLFFFAFAPLIARGRPIRFAEGNPILPEIGQSHVSLATDLHPGDRLWVKERFLQASDEGLKKKSRMVLDWRIPLTCAASGLVEMVEMKNVQPVIPPVVSPVVPPVAKAVRPSSESARPAHVTLSDQSDAHIELTVLDLPAGASVVLRPSFIAGVIVPEGRRLAIRRRWQLFRWQSWITMQFRFFEFVGPCRLVLAGSRGVRVERLGTGDHDPVARRINQDATIGFSPGLDYRPVRAETFWGYYRGMNPLFDDLFAGYGLFLCQEISSPGETASARKFWSRVWSGALRAFGL